MIIPGTAEGKFVFKGTQPSNNSLYHNSADELTPSKETQLTGDTGPPAALTEQVLAEGAPGSLQRVSIRLEVGDALFTHLHTMVEFAALDASIRGSDLADTSLFQSGRPVVIGVTSALVGEGKTTVALHLALDIALNNYKKVCLMDLSLGNNVLAERIGVTGGGPGLVDVLEGTHHAVPTLEAQNIEEFCILPAGRAPNNAARAARSPSLPELMAACREMFDVIVVDMPSVASGNALPIAPHIDGFVFVVQAGITPRQVVQEAMQRIEKQKVLGVVLNRATSAAPKWLRRRWGM